MSAKAWLKTHCPTKLREYAFVTRVLRVVGGVSGTAMASKKKEKAAAKAVAEKQPKVAEETNVNVSLYEELSNNMATILADKTFKKIESEKPLEIEDGGIQAPFHIDHFNTSMKAVGCYKCGFNFFALNLTWSPNPGVPLLGARVDMLVSYYFKQPAPVPFDLVVRVPSLDYNPMEHLGGLQSITAEEIRMAFVKAIARDVIAHSALEKNAQRASDQALKKWLPYVLSSTVTFKLLESDDDVWFEAFNARERLVTDFQALARTAYQRIHEIAQFRTKKLAVWGPGTAVKKICDEFNKRAELAQGSDPVNVDFVQNALSVYEKALCLPDVVVAIEKLEAKCQKNSPFDSMAKLAGIVRKAKDPLAIQWVFCSVADLVLSGKSAGHDFPVRWLIGDANSRTSAVDLYVTKLRLLEFFLGNQMDVMNIPSNVREKIREVLASHKNYRELLSPFHKDAPGALHEHAQRASVDGSDATEQMSSRPDLSWRANWPRSCIMYLSLVERCCFNEEFDATLRTACKMGKSAADIIQYDSFAAAIQQIQETQKKEADQEKERDAAKQTGKLPEEPNNAQDASDPRGTASSNAEGIQPAEQRLQLEAERIVSSNVTLLVEPDNQTAIKAAIMSSNAGKIEGRDGSEYVIIIYDYKQACESKTSPSTRVAPFQQARASKCIMAAIDARRTSKGFPTVSVQPGDMYFLFDGTRSGNMGKLRATFMGEDGAMPKAERRLTLVYGEEAAARRRTLIRGTGSVKQQEGVLIVTRFKPKMVRRKRLHFDGTSAGDAICNIPGPDNDWCLAVSNKRKLYGEYRVEVGGKDGSDDDDDEDEEQDEPPSKKKGRQP